MQESRTASAEDSCPSGRRVLRPGGWVLSNVLSDPDRTETYAEERIVRAEDKLKQESHSRIHRQRDVVRRLETAPFEVAVNPRPFSRGERRRHLLDGDVGWDQSYLCRTR